MDAGTLLSAVQTLFASLQCSELKELYSILAYKSELENLQRTVGTIKAVLHDAESKQVEFELSDQAQLWIEELKDAVYDADDLVDEFVTLAKQKKLMKGGNVSRKVRRLFSRYNPLAIAYKISRGVKEIRKRLDAIASNHNQFGFKLDCQPIRRRREETCSYVYAQDIIGRENDQEKIVSMLLDPDVHQNVSYISIVGIGGLGKTALAQLVYNDPGIKETFPLRLWACVSDQGLEHLDVKATLCKILHSATGTNHQDLALEPLHKKLWEQLEGKKYLLVLDDLWNENRLQWLELVKYLRSDVRGTWILVTTRSDKTATIVEDEHIYKLDGLLKEDSWRLFEMTAFGQRYGQQCPPDLVEIGEGIVKRCANVPLAIRVVGSLLYNQGKEKWLWFLKAKLGRVKDSGNNGIGPILKLSYYHLDPPLKACFSYCALFPKDHVIEKEKLISLWMAQDFIVSQEDQSVEDMGEEYFSILAKRCFFQDFEKDEFGKIISCKIHDLMHDIAQEVSGKEVTNFKEKGLDNKTRHLSYFHMGSTTDLSFPKTKIRTCFRIGNSTNLDTLLRNWKCLRTLDLSHARIRRLPSELVKLLHLRYLDLSNSYWLEFLPNSFGKLHNLQTLSLRGCLHLRELPEDLPELAQLRVLDIFDCWGLNPMPKGLGKLTSLRTLPLFVAGGRKSFSKQNIVDQMEELKALSNLKGSLDIRIRENAQYAKENVKEGGYIRNKGHLNCVTILFRRDGLHKMREDEQRLLLEDLQPHCNVRELRLVKYGGMRMPSWAKEDDLATFLPNLVKLKLRECPGWKHLPSLRNLHNLKSLEVRSLRDLEYIENTSSRGIIGNGVGASESRALFPFLQQLTLIDLGKLKGWWRDDDHVIDCDINQGQQHLLTSFPSLSELLISRCPNFTCVITCPNVEELELDGKLGEKSRIMIPVESGNSKLRIVQSTHAGTLKSIWPTEAFQCVQKMIIYGDDEMESLSEVEEVFRSSSSLRVLYIGSWKKLKTVGGGLKHLTALEILYLRDLPNLMSLSKAGEGEGEGEEVEDDEMPWRCLHQRLQSLSLQDIPELVNLPKGMRYLRALQSLTILECTALESLPESMRELTSLRSLTIKHCSDGLMKRCRKNTGEDWPNIQHICDIRIIEDDDE